LRAAGARIGAEWEFEWHGDRKDILVALEKLKNQIMQETQENRNAASTGN
jgi:hypothetical protein